MHEHHPNLLWSVLKNTTSQTGGKLVLAVIRFLVAMIVLRYAGVERFGEYSLVLTLLLVADWIGDFAVGDAAVREICREPGRERIVLRALRNAKAAQAGLALVCLAALLLLLGYSGSTLRAGLIGGVATLLAAPILVYRAYFKAHLLMERDVGAEIVGALASVPLIWMVSARQPAVEWLVACYVAARLVTLVVVVRLARRMSTDTGADSSTTEALGLVRVAAPLGAAGLLVAFYNSLDLIMLSKLADSRAVGLFSAAQKFVFPVLIAIDAIGATLFPVFASLWQRQEAKFRLILQRGVEAALVVAVGACCVVQVAPGLILSLLGPGLEEAIPLFRLLALALTIRATTFILAPILLVSGMQRYALWLTAAALGSKTILLVWLIPAHGILGVAYAWLATDLLAGLIPAVLLIQRIVGFKIHAGKPLLIFAAGAAASGVGTLTGQTETIWGVLTVAVMYVALVVALRVVSVRDLNEIRLAVSAHLASRRNAA